MAAVRSPPRILRAASTVLASGKQIGTVIGVMKDANLISIGHSRHKAVLIPAEEKEKERGPGWKCGQMSERRKRFSIVVAPSLYVIA